MILEIVLTCAFFILRLYFVALISRWSQHINKYSMKFQGIHTTVVGLNASGTSPSDHMTTSLALYEKATWNTSKTPFPFIACWERLRVHPKWGGQMAEDRKRKREIIIDGEDSVDGASLKDSGRPEGSKRTKQKILDEMKAKSKEDAFERMAKASEDKASCLQHLNQLTSAKLFSAEYGASTEEAQEYHALLRRKALLQLRAGTAPQLLLIDNMFLLLLQRTFHHIVVLMQIFQRKRRSKQPVQFQL